MTSHELRVEGRLENLPRISDFVASCMRDFGLDDRDTFHVQVAVDEACTNIVRYGRISDSPVEVEVTCKMEGDEVLVVVRDNGVPFDPLSTPPPDLKSRLKERKVGGLGVHLMRTLLDRIEYEHRMGKNVLTMVLSLGPRRSQRS